MHRSDLLLGDGVEDVALVAVVSGPAPRPRPVCTGGPELGSLHAMAERQYNQRLPKHCRKGHSDSGAEGRRSLRSSQRVDEQVKPAIPQRWRKQEGTRTRAVWVHEHVAQRGDVEIWVSGAVAVDMDLVRAICDASDRDGDGSRTEGDRDDRRGWRRQGQSRRRRGQGCGRQGGGRRGRWLHGRRARLVSGAVRDSRLAAPRRGKENAAPDRQKDLEHYLPLEVVLRQVMHAGVAEADAPEDTQDHRAGWTGESAGVDRGVM